MSAPAPAVEQVTPDAEPATEAEQPVSEQPQAEQPTTEAPEPPADDAAGSQSPADVDPEAQNKTVELRSPRGALGLDPHQRDLDGRQMAALAAIGIDTKKDPDVAVHVRPFMHMCQVRDLDPYAREAYLIGRGKQGDKKWTMQVGIDGYLKIAGATGRYIGIKKIMWTGPGTDPARDFREDADGVMEPRWWAKWPVHFGAPGAAKAIVHYYDEFGIEREMEAIADWEMYAPYNEVWDGPQGNRHKKIVDGKVVTELTPMWAKGGPHMLAKCALALALRRAFPARMSGMYLHEEMHQADAMERRRQSAEEATARREYAERLRASKRPANARDDVVDAEVVGEADGIDSVLSSPSVPDAPHIIEGEVASGPERLGSILNEAQRRASADQQAKIDGDQPEPPPSGADGGEPTDAERKAWLLDELGLMAKVTGATVPALTRRWVAQHKKNAADADVAELLPLVASLRPLLVEQMRGTDGWQARADLYAQVQPDQCGPVRWLIGEDLAED